MPNTSANSRRDAKSIEPSPGPWTVESTNANGWKGISIKAADGTYIANMVMQPFADNERANARLMASAPALQAEVERLELVVERLAMQTEADFAGMTALKDDLAKALAALETKND